MSTTTKLTRRTKRRMLAALDSYEDGIEERGPLPVGKISEVTYPGEVAFLRHPSEGEWVVVHEWYANERYSDDDLSLTGYRLPHRPGSRREHRSVEGDSIGALREKLGG